MNYKDPWHTYTSSDYIACPACYHSQYESDSDDDNIYNDASWYNKEIDKYVCPYCDVIYSDGCTYTVDDMTHYYPKFFFKIDSKVSKENVIKETDLRSVKDIFDESKYKEVCICILYNCDRPESYSGVFGDLEPYFKCKSKFPGHYECKCSCVNNSDKYVTIDFYDKNKKIYKNVSMKEKFLSFYADNLYGYIMWSPKKFDIQDSIKIYNTKVLFGGSFADFLYIFKENNLYILFDSELNQDTLHSIWSFIRPSTDNFSRDNYMKYLEKLITNNEHNYYNMLRMINS